MKVEGENYTLEKGFTVGLNDLKTMGKERDALMAGLPNMKGKTPEQMDELNAKVTGAVDTILSKHLKNKDNPLFDMIESGARGDPSQLRSILFSQLFVQDAKGRVIPTVIKKNYSEGLDPHEYWTASYGARKGMIDKTVQTSLPGSFSKDILANTIDSIISDIDCGTKKGVNIDIKSKDALDRFLAVDQHGHKRNTLVDQKLVNELNKKGVKTLLVRSPLTCLKAKGICSKCYGLNEHGHQAEIGENVGAKSGQAISEPLVQLVLNTFHTGGAAGTGASATGYQRIQQILEMPALVIGSTSLSPVNGTVKKIEKMPAGGYDITIDDEKIHISRGLVLKVKVGEKIKKGTVLSEGVIKPQEMAKLQGMQQAQEYMVDELGKTYSSQGVNVQRKTFETVVRSVANTTKVTNNPRGNSFLRGDVIPYTVAQHHNENLIEDMLVEEAEGGKLAKSVGGLRAGHELTTRDITALNRAGVKTISIENEAIEHEPHLKSVEQLPLMKKNWMSALGYRNLARALLEGAAQSWGTDLSDYHPVPALAHGALFGKGEQGRY
jgi:DNA-directed RNA polymerase subunit beta'